ncbi:MAG: 16S rRNA (adenine(1518)-N(6)/adenine(1519)-N(6))-dimethyltransferase RsmA [Cyclobacteriaceae bacterium]|nr:16S rRNA (adenine(1518)-N(6)/adenine(1519)-N(6))-dimethyltransferase RsmA [Cyclobacteriaceae bacterium]
MRLKQTNSVRPKKSLGQHFLHDKNIAEKIVQGLTTSEHTEPVLEIGPGMGVLTQFLLKRKELDLTVIEIDRDSVAYLEKHYPGLPIIAGDFLELDLSETFTGRYSIIGNFPYNISSQIFFNVLENRERVWQVVGMVQKEVADRIAAPHGNKTYGILSVLIQAFYTIQYLFKVPPGVFNPPPKVMSAVIRLERNERTALPCDERLFFKVVKQGFNNRRKTLRNALKNLILPAFEHLPPEVLQHFLQAPILDKRAEQLSVGDFIYLTQLMERSRGAADSI